MYLSKLELHGFKSFAQRTVITFDPGITAIVGPNGCGKSNIVDAVRWVIGEQRARILRSEKMDNVIFNGTTKRKALGMAEVLLTIENTRGVLPIEYSEVTLGRRLYRSGESEYILNGVKCRLQDITDLFMDTGMGAGAYSVIELKMIEEILSENAQDRRRLFEEAAGITKYKLRRKQALGKLDSTQADLIRLRDLTDEIDKRVRALKRQAEKASRFRQFEQRLHHLEQALAQIEYDRLKASRQSLESSLEIARQNIEKLSTQQTLSEANLEALRLRLTEQENELAERQKKLNRHLESVRSRETEMRLELERLHGARRDLERTRQEQQDTGARRVAHEESIQRLETALSDAEPALEKTHVLLQDALRARDRAQETASVRMQEVQELLRRDHVVDEERQAVRSRLDRLTSRNEMLEQERSRAQAQLKTLESTSKENEHLAEQTAVRVEEARAALASARASLEQTRVQRDIKEAELSEATDVLHQIERQRDATYAEVGLLESVVASYEEFPDAVQFLAATPVWKTLHLQTVADLLTCDERDRLALDAALGDLTSCIVVQNEDEALRAVSILKEEQKGRATFLLLDRLDERDFDQVSFPPFDPQAQSLCEVVRCTHPSYDRLTRVLLLHSYVVDTLNEAQEAARNACPPSRFFARTGEWVEAQGLLRAGSDLEVGSTLASRIGRREQLSTLQKNLQGLEQILLAQSEQVDHIRAELERIPYEERRIEIGKCEKALSDAEKASERITYEHQTITRRKDELSLRIRNLDAEIEAGHALIEEIHLKMDSYEETLRAIRTERAAAEETFRVAETESRAALTRFNDANIAAIQARNRLENLQRDLDRATQNLKDLDENATKTQGLIEQLTDRITTGEQRHSDLEVDVDRIRQQYSGLDDAVSEAESLMREIKAAISETDVHLRKLRQEREQYIREENSHAVRLAEVQTRISDLSASIQEDFGWSLEQRSISIEADFEEKTARAEVQNLREKIRSLGAVNALALETFEEEKERLDFLMTQRQDLESAEATLLSTINEINSTAAERFKETYEAIHRNFVQIFADLFGEGATSSLEMVNPGDPLESAIEIMAKPRGKKPSTITQLSGGEKTLTAIALLFAIYLVKPSPFCILDEVDAPLDDANVERFMRLIRDFSSDTQFILVTHNKRTMEAADRMYGITMQEQGVSKLVGVKFDDAAAIRN